MSLMMPAGVFPERLKGPLDVEVSRIPLRPSLISGAVPVLGNVRASFDIRNISKY